MKIPANLKIDGSYHQYCLNCLKENITRVYNDNGLTKYSCSSCHKILDRSLVFDPAIVSWIDELGNYWHKSVGILVCNPQGQILLFKRTIFPYVFTIPAGHLDKNETPLQAAKRELKEETGITADSLDLIFEGGIAEDSCRRGSDHHYWYLYKTTVTNSVVTNERNDEGGQLVWLDKDKLLLNDITIPIRFFIERSII
ncbi:MAG: NUDIX hydrolase [Candidatus Doudnabacteria bacterium]|jgi:8-oxo-dGTP pyrophosphatase MutT (NUDIX family)